MNKSCANCGKPYWTTHPAKSFYCSLPCTAAAFRIRFAGAGNPNFRNAGWHKCKGCGKEFRDERRHKRTYCSRECYVAQPETQDRLKSMAKAAGDLGGMSKHARGDIGFRGKDKNHDEIVSAFESMDVLVTDLHTLGNGMLDLFVTLSPEEPGILVEIKNPNSKYGRRGLSKGQKRFLSGWRGSYRIVSDLDGVIETVKVLQRWHAAIRNNP